MATAIRLICVGHGGIKECPPDTQYMGQPIEQWFASRGYLCTTCYVIAQNAPGGVRNGDPYCSREGANKVFGRSGNQRAKLFGVFIDAGEPLTDYDAGERAGMLGNNTCYWKRCGELRERGVLRFIGRSRLTAGSDVHRELSEVTPLGRALWRMRCP